MSLARTIAVLIGSIFILLSSTVAAQQSSTSDQDSSKPMNLIDNAMSNLLPIEGQRFRIDDNVEEITLLFFRERDSAPLIIIRPDGSKWYDSDYPVDRVTWYTDPNFDMVKIKNPEPGPWQVAGRVDEANKAVIVSDIHFEADTLPKQLFANEVIKVEGVLYNGEEPVRTARFRETVLLDVLFVSSNNPDFDNFGAPPTRVANFSDNGQGYDETAGDGVFTGQFALKVVPGEYVPTYQLQTPLYERSFEDEKVVVEAQPVTFEVELSEKKGEDNHLKVSISDRLIDPNSVVINGAISYPNGEERRFSVTEIAEFPHRIPLANLAYGKHLIELSVFATANNQREFELSPQSVSFISVEPVPKPTAAEIAEQARIEAARKARIEQERLEAERQEVINNIIMVAIINVVLIVLAVGFVWWRRRAAKKNTAEAD